MLKDFLLEPLDVDVMTSDLLQHRRHGERGKRRGKEGVPPGRMAVTEAMK